ncbi:hypothetical protein JCM11251_000730 [Rhodosporidiobolus azoricus]
MALQRLLSSPRPSSPLHSSSLPRLAPLATLVSLVSLALVWTIYLAYTSTTPVYPPGTLPQDARGGGAGACRMSFMSPSYLHLSGFGREFTRLGNGPWGLYLYREAGWDADPLPEPGPDGRIRPDSLNLQGTPVLFVPGNAGSFRQVRSLAAAASRTWHERPGVVRSGPDAPSSRRGSAPLDFFTLDFNDDFSAFHGQTLLDQAEYTADCIRYILSLYAHHEDSPDRLHGAKQKRPDPTSVIVVAHSMGGIVARAAVLNKNYQSGSISTLITFATPHLVPPVTVDGGVDRVYAAINSFWREAYGLAPPTHAASTSPELVTTSPHRPPPSSELAHVVLISLSGGLSDLTIASESVSTLSLLPSSGSHGFTVFTTAVPGVNTPIDHLAILWCRELMYKVAEGLLRIVDVRRKEGVVDREERVRELSRMWVGDAGGGSSVKSGGGKAGMGIPLKRILPEGRPAHLLSVGERLVHRSSHAVEADWARYVLPIPPSQTYTGRRVFSLLTNAKVDFQKGRRGRRVEVYACAWTPSSSPSTSGDFPLNGAGATPSDSDLELDLDRRQSPSLGFSDPHASCISLPVHLSTPLPPSPHTPTSPVLPAPIAAHGEDPATEGMTLVEVGAEQEWLEERRGIVVLVRDEKERADREGEKGVWVVAEWAERERREMVADKGPFQLLLSPYKFSLPFFAATPTGRKDSARSSRSPAALISDVYLPALETSLLTLRARVWRGGCHDSAFSSFFAPLLIQSSASSPDLPLFETKIFPSVRAASLYTHSSGPFLPPSSASSSSSSALPANGAKLRFLLDPICAASGGRDGQLEVEISVDWWRTVGSLVVRYRMAMVTVPFAMVAIVMAGQMREFDAGNPFPSFGPSLSRFLITRPYPFPLLVLILFLLSYLQSFLLSSHSSLHSTHPHPYSHAAEALPSAWVKDALLGNGEGMWAWVAPFLVTAGMGIVVLEWVVVSLAISGMAGVVRVLQKRGWISLNENRENLPLQRILTIIALLLTVLVFSPYQFAYLVLVLVHLWTTVRALLAAWEATPSSPPSLSAKSSSTPATTTPPSTAITPQATRSAWSFYHFTFSLLLLLLTLLPINALILVVWVRNLAVGWLAPFNSDHNILLLVGYLAVVESAQGGRMLLRPAKGGARSASSLLTSALLLLPAAFSLLYGIRSAHALYPLTNLFMLWLAIRTSPAIFGAGAGEAVPAAGVLGGNGALGMGASGKRRTSAPPEPVADLLEGGSGGAGEGQGGVVRKTASVGSGGSRRE